MHVPSFSKKVSSRRLLNKRSKDKTLNAYSKSTTCIQLLKNNNIDSRSSIPKSIPLQPSNEKLSRISTSKSSVRTYFHKNASNKSLLSNSSFKSGRSNISYYEDIQSCNSEEVKIRKSAVLPEINYKLAIARSSSSIKRNVDSITRQNRVPTIYNTESLCQNACDDDNLINEEKLLKPSNSYHFVNRKKPEVYPKTTVTPPKKGLTPCEAYDMPPTSMARLQQAIEEASRQGRTFMLRSTLYGLRAGLIERGWYQKISPFDRHYQYYINRPIEYLRSLMNSPDKQKYIVPVLKSKFIRGIPNFIWSSARHINWSEAKHSRFISCFPHGTFSHTNKRKITLALKHGNTVRHQGRSFKLLYPRTYAISSTKFDETFLKDYRLTAAMSLLKMIVEIVESTVQNLVSSKGSISVSVFEFAANECCKFISKIKKDKGTIKEASDKEWEEFLIEFNNAATYNLHFQCEDKEVYETTKYIIKRTETILNCLADYYSCLRADGCKNLWILKPHNGSQGHGIRIYSKLNDIRAALHRNSSQEYVIQKYIERPLLIYQTKFDIRQWFLVTDINPLKIWMYKKCYLRFSSQTFNLRRLHEAIHLTNNSVQYKYHTQPDVAIPSYHMWDSDEFRLYLSNIGHPDIYDRKIYPGMKDCIIGTTLINYKPLSGYKMCFQLFGADFLITDEFEPYLLEVNGNPAMYVSTPITGKMTRMCLTDLLKVVIDYPYNRKANTGEFELIFNGGALPLPQENISVSTEDISMNNRRYDLNLAKKSSTKSQRHKDKKQAFPREKMLSAVSAVQIIRKITSPSYERMKITASFQTDDQKIVPRHKRRHNAQQTDLCEVLEHSNKRVETLEISISTRDYQFHNNKETQLYDPLDFTTAEDIRFVDEMRHEHVELLLTDDDIHSIRAELVKASYYFLK